MNRLSLSRRLVALAAMLFILSIPASMEMRAQEDSPFRITIIVAKSVGCDVIVDYTGGNTSVVCSPGTATYLLGDVPAYIYDCHGTPVRVSTDVRPPCTFNIPITAECCVDACISYDQQARPVVTITRGECTCDDDGGDID